MSFGKTSLVTTFSRIKLTALSEVISLLFDHLCLLWSNVVKDTGFSTLF